MQEKDQAVDIRFFSHSDADGAAIVVVAVVVVAVVVVPVVGVVDDNVAVSVVVADDKTFLKFI